MHESNNRDFYSQDSDTYESTRFSSATGRDDHDRLMACVSQLANALDLQEVVEVGVGTGRVTRVLLSQGAQSIRCVDIAPGMLKVAEQLTASPKVRYLEGSAYELPIPSNDCSAFVSINLLSHLDDLNQFWREAARVLRPGGMALVNSPKVDSMFLPFGVIANQRGTAFGQKVHSVWHRRKDQLRAISNAGGQLQSIAGHYYTPRALGEGAASAIFHRVMYRLDRLPSRLSTRLAPMDLYLVKF